MAERAARIGNLVNIMGNSTKVCVGLPLGSNSLVHSQGPQAMK